MYIGLLCPVSFEEVILVKTKIETFLVVQRLGLHAFTGAGTSLIPSQGTKFHQLGIRAQENQKKTTNKGKQMNKQNYSCSKIDKIHDDISNKI